MPSKRSSCVSFKTRHFALPPAPLFHAIVISPLKEITFMAHSRKLSHLAALCLILAAALLVHGRALAHGHVDVGEYSLTIGFLNEPALVGEPNAVSLEVVHHGDEQ